MPGIAPPQVTVKRVLTATSANVSWTIPPLIYHNGVIQGYRLKYFLVDQPQNVIIINVGNKTKSLLTSLQTLRKYSIQVAVYNSIGTGPYSQAIIYQTYNGGNCSLQLN